jgi:hypothetical protein
MIIYTQIRQQQWCWFDFIMIMFIIIKKNIHIWYKKKVNKTERGGGFASDIRHPTGCDTIQLFITNIRPLSLSLLIFTTLVFFFLQQLIASIRQRQSNGFHHQDILQIHRCICIVNRVTWCWWYRWCNGLVLSSSLIIRMMNTYSCSTGCTIRRSFHHLFPIRSYMV